MSPTTVTVPANSIWGYSATDRLAGPDFRHRSTTLQDDDALPGRLYAIQNRQAPSLEFGRIDRFHDVTSIDDWSH